MTTKYNIGDKVKILASVKIKPTCPICEGTGEIFFRENNFSCPKCLGSGYTIEYIEKPIIIPITDIHISGTPTEKIIVRYISAFPSADYPDYYEFHASEIIEKIDEI